MRAESFPCLVCGDALLRVMDEAEGQPSDGLMCQSHGNYGSTVFDPFDLSYLAFNVCDPCMTEAAAKGRVMVTRSWQLVEVPGFGVVGRTRCDRPYVPWHSGLPDDDAKLSLDVDELRTYAERIEFKVPIEDVEAYLSERR